MNFIKIKNSIELCDIGAGDSEKQRFIDELLKNTKCKITGFEPNKKQFEKLIENENKKYFNYAIGDGTEKEFNICEAPGMSSFLKPDINYNKMFHKFNEWGKIIDIVKVKTKKLDDLEINKKFDIIKIDVQGYESEIIKYGQKKIKDALAIQIEVSPVSSYENAKPFPYVYNQLENLGFDLHMFSKIEKRAFAPMIINNNLKTGLHYLYQLDCVFIKKFKIINQFDEEELKKLIHIMFYGFKAYDFVLFLISILEKKTRNNETQNYSDLIKTINITKK